MKRRHKHNNILRIERSSTHLNGAVFMSDLQKTPKTERTEKEGQDSRDIQWTSHVVYDYESPEFSKRRFEIRFDDVEALRIYSKSVALDKMPNGSSKMTVKFFASREIVEFYSSLDMDKLRHIVLTQYADDGSWSSPVVDGTFVCCNATLNCSTPASADDELVLGFVQYGSVPREKRLFHD